MNFYEQLEKTRKAERKREANDVFNMVRRNNYGYAGPDVYINTLKGLERIAKASTPRKRTPDAA